MRDVGYGSGGINVSISRLCRLQPADHLINNDSRSCKCDLYELCIIYVLYPKYVRM